jgi:flagellar biosynthesis/type III secretory pathway protein FliH
MRDAIQSQRDELAEHRENIEEHAEDDYDEGHIRGIEEGLHAFDKLLGEASN